MSEKAERMKALTRKRVRDFREKNRILNAEKTTISSESNNSFKMPFETVNNSFSQNESFQDEIDDFEDHLSLASESDRSSNSSDSFSENEVEEPEEVEHSIAADLKKWAINNSITHSSLDSLLKILKPHYKNLPISAKTLLKSNLNFNKLVKNFNSDDPQDDAKFVYFGISINLQRQVRIDIHDNILRLQFCADGMPIYRSSSTELWPILGRVYRKNFLYKPFVIAVHCGIGKPRCIERYLQDFIKELNMLLEESIDINGRHFNVEIMCFVCDKPARSFLKCIKSHNSYHACERCDVKGVYFKRRIVYPSLDSNKRTDRSFRTKSDPQHHHMTTPLTRVKIDMVEQFVMDFMHMGCLGVMKKLLVDYWLAGTNNMSQLSRENILRVSQRLMNISNQIPLEFQRSTRTLGEVSKWKATEFRFFLLYCGPFVLKDVLKEDEWKHFLLFHVACRILSCEKLCIIYVHEAGTYLQRFVVLMHQLYGLQSQIFNVHSLVHLADDVKNMQSPLTEFTAFPFENALGKIKKFIRSRKNPIQQLCKRLEEIFLDDEEVMGMTGIEIITSRKKNDEFSISKIKSNGYTLTTKKPNNIIILKNDDVVEITEIKLKDNINLKMDEMIMHGRKLQTDGTALLYPSDSSVLKMYRVQELNPPVRINFNIKDIYRKAVKLEIFELQCDKKECFVIPLLHH